MPPSRRRSSRRKEASAKTLEQLWRFGLIAVLAVALSPGNFAFVDYGAELLEKSYALIKAGMPFIPLGAVLMLVWRKAEIQIVTLALYLVLLPALWVLPDWGWMESRNMLFAWPGLALGMSLAAASLRAFAPPVKSAHHR
ncbi:MAG: hypothetical protein B7Y41_08225 [Hydrogenophilales bacterium 28-61-23]|nr:MAG: hypothetical protein B7Y41_08225 [Hydrogenophilales bacterium 28-61-23]